MKINAYIRPAFYPENPSPHGANRWRPTVGNAILEFGRFRVLLRQRKLVANGAPIELGSRALDVLLVLLEADGSLVTKSELMSRVWPGIAVAEENLKVQISALRKALGEDRDFIRTEFGRGYRFTAKVHLTAARGAFQRLPRRRRRSNQRLVFGWTARRSHGRCAQDHPAQTASSLGAALTCLFFQSI
jgi:DNA-binding winged helix-turn-helix (wHTH) protein